MAVEPQTLFICSTQRLAKSVAHSQANRSLNMGLQITPQALTLTQWLQQTINQAMLVGDIATADFPPATLSPFAEKLLWQQAIERSLSQHTFASLFNVQSLAEYAQQAHQTLIEWQVPNSEISHYFSSEETRQFLQWRKLFLQLNAAQNKLDNASLKQAHITLIGNIKLDNTFNKNFKQLIFIGFDRFTPLEKKLLSTLEAQNCAYQIQTFSTENNVISQCVLADRMQECRAAVAWAQAKFAQKPEAKLAIISPCLADIRRPLQDLLDDNFHAETLYAGAHETPRIYDFSLGAGLDSQAIIASALLAIRLACQPKYMQQADISAFLLDPYWGANAQADTRAQLDAQMRKKLPRRVSWAALIRLTEHSFAHLLPVFQPLQAFQQHARKALPSVWQTRIEALLNDLQMAKSRPQTSYEFQTLRAWQTVLTQFAQLDSLTGAISSLEAAKLLRQLCVARIFQPENKGKKPLQVLGMLESVAEPLDGIWVIGMNEENWPPAPRPNPLLPYHLQADLQTPNADSRAQHAFGAQVFERLRQSAREVIFSYAQAENDRALRPSILLNTLPAQDLTVLNLSKTLSEQWLKSAQWHWQVDETAPAVSAARLPKGGTKLLEAQSICPAWAFYQFRLGANALQAPTDGMDSRLRGQLLHAAMQFFWQTHQNSAILQHENLANLVDNAVETALQNSPELREMADNWRKIEKNCLSQLLLAWLEKEAERASFSVQACEQKVLITVQGLQIDCRIDRIDEAADGLVIVDYKSGAAPSLAGWAQTRLQNVQLPVYAALALKDEKVVGVCFAQLKPDEQKWVGVTDTEDCKGLTKLEKTNKNQVITKFTSVDSLIQHWQYSLENLAQEIMQGEVRVCIEDENDVKYCEVKPLLRLPERAWQFEHFAQISAENWAFQKR